MVQELEHDVPVGRREAMKGLGLLAAGLGVEALLGPGFAEAAKKPAKPKPKPKPKTWHELTQSQRNDRIIVRAVKDARTDVRRNCKEWVDDVVWAASGNLVDIPSTASNLYSWLPSADVGQRSRRIRYAEPGDIIQMLMRQRGGGWIEHTAIVYAVYTGPGLPYEGMTFVESNYGGDLHVQYRHISFVGFLDQVQNYSIYYIL